MNGVQQYVKLENRLVLLAWLNSLLGYQSNRELLEDCKNVGEGFHADGRSFLFSHLIARGYRRKIPAEKLAEYDENIRLHLEKINHKRAEKVTLRYFQHLAALFTEIFLDRRFNAKAQLLEDLNNFVDQRNKCRSSSEPRDEPFTESDLTRLAFWMATGSGKTLLLHLNYHQFLHYNKEPLDNILLITPNAGLSEQHLAALTASDIPAQRFDPNASSQMSMEQHVVQVIEITKLVEEKRGGGVSVPVAAFEGRNLIFVDEGHKGSGGQAWRSYRDALGKTGFTFEYSATFGQALSAARNDPLTAEYGKSIVFDYSYKYFYGDGFGKDFRILNLEKEEIEKTDTLLLGALLSFYEQLRLYQELSREKENNLIAYYNLEKPLLVFVGGTVNAVYAENSHPRSDVLTVVRFLHRVLSDGDWAVETLKSILQGTTGLFSANGVDVFAGQFPFVKEKCLDPQRLYEDMLKRLFHVPACGGLRLCDMKSAPGELGLKAAGARTYFGVVSIGDVAAFKKLLENEEKKIVQEQDAISSSLFECINRSDSDIHVLIGAKKFMEGWNSWRVASMGLLNIGRQEGSQIIQLFGRGVRLKGKGMSLKRSAALKGDHPDPDRNSRRIRLLETLNIFAVRASYMAQFREYLEREGVDVEPAIELPLFIQVNDAALKRGLVIPRLPDDRDFVRETSLLLEPDDTLNVQVDLSARVQIVQSAGANQTASADQRTAGALNGQAQAIPQESLFLVDWQQVYLDVLDYKTCTGRANLVIQPNVLPQIISLKNEKGNPVCTVIADAQALAPHRFADRALLQQTVTRLLCRYVDRFYQKRRAEWENDHLVYVLLDQDDPNLNFRPHGVMEEKAGYVIKVSASDQEFVQELQELLNNQQRLYNQEDNHLPLIHFDRHIYQPLLLDTQKVQITPSGLNKSEAQFVRDLGEYWKAEQNGALKGKEVFLLRNLSRGRGVGFFEEQGFYPDFILWIVEDRRQRIIFVEPHGMLNAPAYEHDNKARLWEELPALAARVAQCSGRANVSLDSFIISATPYNDLYKRYDNGTWSRKDFADRHILFPERTPNYDYMKLLFAIP